MQDDNLQNTNPAADSLQQPVAQPTQPTPQPTIQPEQPIQQPVAQQMPPVNIQPVATQTPQPMAQTPQPVQTQANEAMKWIKYTGTTAIVMGILSILIGCYVAYYYDVIGLLDALTGVIYTVVGIQLRNPQITVKNTLSIFKILTLLLLIGLVAAVLAKRGPGLINMLILYFMFKAIEQLHKAGQITSKSVVLAKPTQQ